MKYTTRQIEEAANKLRALPAKKRTRNASTAVQMLQAEFSALLERGYTLEQAGRALHKAGIEVSALTVLASLGSASGAPRKRAPRRKPTEPRPQARSSTAGEAEPAAAQESLPTRAFEPVAIVESTPSRPSEAVLRPLATLAIPEPSPRTTPPPPPPRPPVARTTPPPPPPLPPVARTTPPPPPSLPLPTVARTTPPPLPSLPRFQVGPRGIALPPPPPPSRVFKRGNVNLPNASFQVRPDTPDSEL